MSDKVDDLLNPEVKEIQIGTRDSKIVTVYPLSYYNQKKIIEQVRVYMASSLAEKGEETSDIDYLGSLSVVLEKNIKVLIDKCTDLDKKTFMADITSGQLVSFLSIIVEVNFVNPLAQGVKLFTNMGSMYGAKQLSPLSANITDTDSVTSRTPIKMEDLP
ncbi:MAG: hypothetical protein DRN14_03595 [Thermoplasmata archaeon]|nr:MAG: hypothetical protein DRN14_03595 [Thermoplasmata archaeon]